MEDTTNILTLFDYDLAFIPFIGIPHQLLIETQSSSNCHSMCYLTKNLNWSVIKLTPNTCNLYFNLCELLQVLFSLYFKLSFSLYFNCRSVCISTIVHSVFQLVCPTSSVVQSVFQLVWTASSVVQSVFQLVWTASSVVDTCHVHLGSFVFHTLLSLMFRHSASYFYCRTKLEIVIDVP